MWLNNHEFPGGVDCWSLCTAPAPASAAHQVHVPISDFQGAAGPSVKATTGLRRCEQCHNKGQWKGHTMNILGGWCCPMPAAGDQLFYYMAWQLNNLCFLFLFVLKTTIVVIFILHLNTSLVESILVRSHPLLWLCRQLTGATAAHIAQNIHVGVGAGRVWETVRLTKQRRRHINLCSATHAHRNLSPNCIHSWDLSKNPYMYMGISHLCNEMWIMKRIQKQNRENILFFSVVGFCFYSFFLLNSSTIYLLT